MACGLQFLPFFASVFGNGNCEFRILTLEYLGLSGAQHRIRLGKYKRDSDSVQREGENMQAVWSPDTKLIAILVSVPPILNIYFLQQSHLFKVNISCVNCNAILISVQYSRIA